VLPVSAFVASVSHGVFTPARTARLRRQSARAASARGASRPARRGLVERALSSRPHDRAPARGSTARCWPMSRLACGGSESIRASRPDAQACERLMAKACCRRNSRAVVRFAPPLVITREASTRARPLRGRRRRIGTRQSRRPRLDPLAHPHTEPIFMPSTTKPGSSCAPRSFRVAYKIIRG